MKRKPEFFNEERLRDAMERQNIDLMVLRTVENSIYLKPAIHRRGIGLMLMQRLLTECTARGYRQVIAVIGDSANAGSVGVHSRCGFQMIGTHPNVGLKFGRWLDIVMMQLPLGEGATTVPKA